MKRQEHSKHLLGLAMIVVWGLLGYRIYQKFNPAKVVYVRQAEPIKAVEVEAIQEYTLLVNYQDPFLDKKVPKTVPGKPKIPVAPPQRPSPKPIKKVVVFPKVEYKGRLKTKDGHSIALVRVNQSVFNWGKGDTYRKLELIHIYEDSIRISYRGVEKIIEKAR